MGLAFFALYSLLPPVSGLLKTLLKGPSSIISFTQDPSQNLQATNDRTNLLLLGIGGDGHEGALLTDSMLILSYNHQTKKATLISLPRDLWVDSLKTKINATYYYGEQQQSGGGLLLTKSATKEVTGLPIHYAFVINFEGFKQAIDLVGGIDINIHRSFDDYLYPIPGMENAYPEELRYQHLHFDAGLEHMDGDRALKFVRSRHAEGEEGTDFARNQRQQQVLLALKERLVSTQTLLNPKKITELFDLYRQYIDTDILDTEYAAFAKVALTLDREELTTISLSTGDEETAQLGILEYPTNRTPYQGQYVLIARDGNWNALKQFIQNQLQ
jgi:LCP family protein required for cell wall assembly